VNRETAKETWSALLHGRAASLKELCSRGEMCAPWTASNQNSKQKKEEDDWRFLPCISHCCSIGGSGGSGSGIMESLGLYRRTESKRTAMRKEDWHSLMCSPLQQSMSYFDWCRNRRRRNTTIAEEDDRIAIPFLQDSEKVIIRASWVDGFDDAWAAPNVSSRWLFKLFDTLLLGNCIHLQQ
jgi:hypothetical protein